MGTWRGVAILSVVGVTFGGPAWADDGGGSLTIAVDGLRNDTGQVGCMLFASADGFPSSPEKAAGKTYVPISGKAASCTFPGLKPGSYAAVVMHDENANGKLDRNVLGIPSEGWGASRDARGFMGPPKWADAVFTFPGGSGAMRIAVHY